MKMGIDSSEQIEKFKEFLEQEYEKELYLLNDKGHFVLNADFSRLMMFDPELADQLLEDPEETVRSIEIATEGMNLKHQFRVRIFNLPKSQFKMIKDIRSNDLGNFLSIEGIVRQASDVRPQVTSAKFECPSCGNVISILQLDTKFKEPSRCSCGRRGKFRLLSKILVDAQRLVIEEIPEYLEGGEQPKRLSVFLKEDLVEPKMEKRTTPGSKVRIVGVVKEVPILLKTGAQSIRYDLAMECNFIESMEELFEDLDMTKEEEEEIITLSKNPKIYEMLMNSIAPQIKGHHRIKEAIILQLMGGVSKSRTDGTKTRGDIHILLVGDPGTAKSTLIASLAKITPKSRMTSGKSATGAGLCVAPDSLILTNPSGIMKAQDFIEDNLKNNEEVYCEGVYKNKKSIENKYVWSFDKNLKLQSKNVENFWKLKSPKYMYKIKLRSGKSIEVTGNTKLYSLDNGNLIWKKSSEYNLGDYIATSRRLEEAERYQEVNLFGLIDQNPVIHGVKDRIKNLLKEHNKRELAKKLGFNEANLYYNWINKNARGNIHFKDYKKLLNFMNHEIEDNLIFSLYNGKKFRLPNELDNDFMYFLGLVAGDGNLSHHGTGYAIGFSNSSEQLIKKFENIVIKLFNQKCNITKGNKKRPDSIRFHNKVLFRLINKLGIPQSPKSNKIDISNYLLNLPNEKIKYFISGLFDCDGSVVLRKSKGSNYIELTTTSENLAKKIQLLLLRFNIISKLRKRKPSIGKIKGNFDKYEILIGGRENLMEFKNKIGFYYNKKKEKLSDCIDKISCSNTNIDIVPNIKRLLTQYKINCKSNLSQNRLKKLVKENRIKNEILNKLSNSDIFWDKIVEINKIESKYDYLYDLTVNDSHSFLVNGVLVHNTATVVRDEFLRGWALEAGAIVLANGGYLFIDELDKMSHEDRNALHEGLEQQRISISKANIQAVLKAETTVLAAANPKLGRFDPYTPIASQIDLPSTLINRFDLIFPIRDLPSREEDTRIATHVLMLHKKPQDIKPELPKELFRRYLSYVKRKVKPVLSESAIEEIRNFYVELRNKGTTSEDEIRPIPISARQLEALVRMAEGSAKVRLSNKVLKQDAKRAINILKHCLMQVGFDYETGQIDIDRITSGITTSQRSRLVSLKEIIRSLEEKFGKKIPLDEILSEAANKGIDESHVEESIEKLKREGEIFEPLRNMISRV